MKNRSKPNLFTYKTHPAFYTVTVMEEIVIYLGNHFNFALFFKTLRENITLECGNLIILILNI